MKKRIGFLATLLLTLSGVTGAYADAYLPEDTPRTGDTVMFSVWEDSTGGLSQTMLIANKSKGNKQESWNCTSIDDPECKLPSKADSLWGATVLGVCASAIDVNCIEDFQIGLEGQELKSAVYKEQTLGWSTPAKPEVNYPGGGNTTLWIAEHAPTPSGSTSYAVNMRMGGGMQPGGNWTPGDLMVNVSPYRVLSGDRYKTLTSSDRVDEDGLRRYGFNGGAGGSECVWADDGRCGRLQDFAAGTKVKVVVRVPKSLGGWFKGRMKGPNIEVSSFNRDFNRISVEAEPVEVPRVFYEVEREKMTAKEKEFFADSSGGTKYGVGSWALASYGTIFDWLSYFKEKVNDTAAGTNIVWNFGTVDTGRGSRCLVNDSRVQGIVTTNSLGYDGSSPSYSRGSLNYRVTGLHFSPDGKTPVLGTYDLVMRSDVARCLYGLSRAPVGATITVAGEGDTTIATTVVGERNGWLKLAAYGFTFSNKTIKVKLTQKRSTITCVSVTKPTNTRKVTGFSPKCPTGFVKR